MKRFSLLIPLLLIGIPCSVHAQFMPQSRGLNGYNNTVYNGYGVSNNVTSYQNPWTTSSNGVSTPVYQSLHNLQVPSQNNATGTGTENGNGNGTSDLQKPLSPDALNHSDKKAVSPERQSQNLSVPSSSYGQVISGIPTVINAITLLIDGHSVVLSGITAPKNDAQCMKQHGMEWSCGRASEDTLRGLVEKHVTQCFMVSDNQGICSTPFGNVAQAMVSAGYALSLAPSSFMNDAKKDHRGLWDTDIQTP